jgi:hypothetical protein
MGGEAAEIFLIFGLAYYEAIVISQADALLCFTMLYW